MTLGFRCQQLRKTGGGGGVQIFSAFKCIQVRAVHRARHSYSVIQAHKGKGKEIYHQEIFLVLISVRG
jgi:hypothetical protein